MENFEKESKKKKSGGLLVVLLLIIIAIAAGAGYYFWKISKPKYVFEKSIDGLLSSDISTTNDITKFKTAKITTDISAKVNSEEDEMKAIAEILNDAKLTLTTEVDFENKEDVVGVKLVKEKDDLLDAKMKIEEESQKMYIDLGELFGKTIKLNVKDVLDDEIKTQDTSVSSIGQMVNELKAEQIAKTEIKKQLKDEYFSTEKVSLDGTNLTKNELKISGKEFVEMLKTICNDLSNNEEFLACYEDKDAVKDSFKDFAENIDDIDVDKDTYIIIDIYTSGIMKNVERTDISVDDGTEKITLQLTENGEGRYIYKIVVNDKTEVEGYLKLKIDKKDFAFEISMKYEETEVTLNIHGNVVYDEEIEKFDTKESVEMDDITMEDYYEIMGNLSESKLYQIVDEVLGSYDSSSNSYLDDEDDDSFYEDDNDYEYEEDENDE